MQSTTNYNLPTYEGTDAPNLITGYNAAMAIIDSTLKSIADTVEFNPQPTTDANFDVSKLGAAKVTSNGIVYFIANN
jgi:hypothetical protein